MNKKYQVCIYDHEDYGAWFLIGTEPLYVSDAGTWEEMQAEYLAAMDRIEDEYLDENNSVRNPYFMGVVTIELA